MNNSIITKFLEEIESLQRAKELLEKVYLEIGPYCHRDHLPDELIRKIHDYFGFDDSE